jgi:hypothetical protein
MVQEAVVSSVRLHRVAQPYKSYGEHRRFKIAPRIRLMAPCLNKALMIPYRACFVNEKW